MTTYGRKLPIDWEHLPDIELYMDQVLYIVNSQDVSLKSDGELTASMINNYVKAGLLPRTKSKRYSKKHLARLIIINTLKSILTVTQLKALFDASTLTDEELYEQFRQSMLMEEELFASVSQNADSTVEAIRHAIAASLFKQRAQQILEGISEDDG